MRISSLRLVFHPPIENPKDRSRCPLAGVRFGLAGLELATHVAELRQHGGAYCTLGKQPLQFAGYPLCGKFLLHEFNHNVMLGDQVHHSEAVYTY